MSNEKSLSEDLREFRERLRHIVGVDDGDLDLLTSVAETLDQRGFDKRCANERGRHETKMLATRLFEIYMTQNRDMGHDTIDQWTRYAIQQAERFIKNWNEYEEEEE